MILADGRFPTEGKNGGTMFDATDRFGRDEFADASDLTKPDLDFEQLRHQRDAFNPEASHVRNKYGQTTLKAIALIRTGICQAPPKAWQRAAQEIFPNSFDSQNKGCTKGAFLGLCQEGLVKGVPQGCYTRSNDNRAYAIQAVNVLRRATNAVGIGASELWTQVMNGRIKKPNSQMDVVLALWHAGEIVGS